MARSKKTIKLRNSGSDTQLNVFDPDAETPGEKIHSVAHGFRLHFNGLGQQRKLTDDQYDLAAGELGTDADCLGLVKYLHDSKHKSVSALNKAKSQAKICFDAATLPFPELAVRLLPVHSSDEEEQQEEIKSFCREVRDKLVTFERRREELKDDWDDVLKHNKARLKKLFSAGDYPSADALDRVIQAHFEPYNFALPAYLQHVDPAEYRRCQQQLVSKFDRAARMHEEVLSKAIVGGLGDMLQAIQGFHDGKKRCFTDNTVGKVFRGLEAFRSAQERYGMMKGTGLASAFSDLEEVLREGTLDAESLPRAIRASEDKRNDVMQKVKEVMGSISDLMSEAPSRKLIRHNETRQAA